MFDLDREIRRWCKQVTPGFVFRGRRIAELEDHVHCATALHVKEGYSKEQAFQLAIKSLGDANHLRREFRKSTGAVSLLLSHRSRFRMTKPSLVVAASILIAAMISNSSRENESFAQWAKNTVVALCMMPLKRLTGSV